MPDWLLKLPIWLQVHIRTLAAEMLELEGSAAYRRAKATPWDRAHERMRAGPTPASPATARLTASGGRTARCGWHSDQMSGGRVSGGKQRRGDDDD